MSDEYCYCGLPMDQHTAWGSCTTPRVNPQPEFNYGSCERCGVDLTQNEAFEGYCDQCGWYQEQEA